MEVILPLRSLSWQTLLHSAKSQPMQLYSLVWVQHTSCNVLMDLILNDVSIKAKTVPTWLTIYPVLPLQSVMQLIAHMQSPCVWYNGVDPSRKYSCKEPTVCSRAPTVCSMPSFIYTSTYKRVLWSPSLYNWGNWGTERPNDSKNCSYSESQNLNFVTGFRVSSYMQFWMLIMLTLTFVFQRQVYASDAQHQGSNPRKHPVRAHQSSIEDCEISGITIAEGTYQS